VRLDDPSFIVLTETKFSFRCIPVNAFLAMPQSTIKEGNFRGAEDRAGHRMHSVLP